MRNLNEKRKTKAIIIGFRKFKYIIIKVQFKLDKF